MDLQLVFTEAVQHHSQGRLEQAKEKYLQVLQALPDNINVLGNIGIVCRDLGQLEEALRYCRKAVELSPQDATQLVNLGAVYEADDNLEAAREAYEKAVSLSPGHPKALNNLGKILHLQGRATEALSFLERAVAVEPNYPLALNNIGVILSERGDTKAAVPYLEKSYSLDSTNVNTNYNLAGLYNVLGEEEKACRMLENVLRLQPEHASAKHMLAAIGGATTDTAPKEYVVETFDRYAARFDTHLQGALCYDVPDILAEMVSAATPGRQYVNCLDLGCGTGLSGNAFQPLCRSITGVDLSSQMIERAREKGIYSSLHCLDIYQFLQKNSERYDLYISADVFIYLGRLDTFFKQVERSAPAGAVLACSIESCDDEKGYVLRSSGRYAHSPDYLISQAGAYGFDVLDSRQHGIRKENKQWIPGHLFVLQKTAVFSE